MATTVSQGTILKIGETAVANITGWTGPNASRTVIDATSLASTSKEFQLGLKDHGEYSFDINYNPSVGTHATLEAAFDAATLTTFTIVFTNEAEQEFSGYVMSFQPQGALDSLVTASVTIKISGDVTRTAPEA